MVLAPLPAGAVLLHWGRLLSVGNLVANLHLISSTYHFLFEFLSVCWSLPDLTFYLLTVVSSVLGLLEHLSDRYLFLLFLSLLWQIWEVLNHLCLF